MQKNFFTGRTQLYKNRGGCSNGEGVSVTVSVGDVYIENNVTIEYQSPKITINYGDDDELKPLFKKVI